MLNRRFSPSSLLLLTMMSTINAFMNVQRRSVRFGYIQQSYSALFSTLPSTEPEESPTRKSSNTGGLRRLPVVSPSNELVNKASRVPRIVGADEYVESS